MIKAAFRITMLFGWLTQSATTPLRTGDVARQLTEQDVAALEAALPTGSTPWLLNGEPPHFGILDYYIQAYLPPTTVTRELWRGTVISVMRRMTPVGEWRVQRTDSYAQVAIAGRNFNDVQGDQDINRPFRVVGSFGDDELVRLVQLLRSDRAIRGPDHIQPWPIGSIERKGDDSVEVMLRETHSQGQVVKLRQAAQDWVIVIVGMWAI